MSNLKLYFYGGVGSVTGANFILEDSSGEKPSRIMVDCGLVQGGPSHEKQNFESFLYNPKDVDVLIVTHAHMDHIGRIPKLVKDGFNGVIYSTRATREIVKFMFEDELKLMRLKDEDKDHEMLFDEVDVAKTLSLWKDVDYYNPFNIADFVITLRDAGHILGSAIVEVVYKGQKIVFTGDLGNSPSPFLRDTDIIENVDYLIMESVYGDRNHEDKAGRSAKLKKIILDAIKKKGTLLIPAFSLERTQILLYEINNFIENGDIPSIPVFLDSPLAIKITDVYGDHRDEFKDIVREEIYGGDDIFNFPRLEFTKSTMDSQKILSVPSPKIVIAGSGMSYGGRILSHEQKYLSDSNNTILFVGYQAVGSLGRSIQGGNKTVFVSGKEMRVRAHIESIMSYSSHKDSENLIKFVESTASTLKKVFVVMGEPKSSLFLAQRLRDYLEVNAVVPVLGDKVELV